MVKIREFEFETDAAAAAHFGVTRHQIRWARRRGKLDLVGLRMSVVVRGQFFPSARACAEHFGLTISTVHKQIEMGRQDWIGTGSARAGHEKSGKQITIGPRTFSSMAAADRALGLRNGYVSHARRGCRGFHWEQVVAAAMELNAKERRAREAAKKSAELSETRRRNAASRAAAALSIAAE